MQTIIMPYYTPTTPRSGQIIKTFFSEGQVALKEKKLRALGKFIPMHAPESKTLLCR